MCPKHLINYLTSNKIKHSFQSAYLPAKYTETAITRITSDLLSNINNKYGSILALLDLSPTFDTIDHNILLSRISDIGIIGTSHKWLKSFITRRSSSIHIHLLTLSPHISKHGVPQGSVLGSILFNICIFPLLDIISNLLLNLHTYVTYSCIYRAMTTPANPKT